MSKAIVIKRELNADNELLHINLSDNLVTTELGVWDYSKYYNRNYMAIIHRDAQGNDNPQWLKASKNKDEFFNVADLKVGDIFMAGVSCPKQKNNIKRFYAVISKDVDGMDVLKDTTYLKVKKQMEEVMSGAKTAAKRKDYYIIKNELAVDTAENGQIKFYSSEKKPLAYSYDGKNWTKCDLDGNNNTWISYVPVEGDKDIYIKSDDDEYVYYPSLYVHPKSLCYENPYVHLIF